MLPEVVSPETIIWGWRGCYIWQALDGFLWHKTLDSIGVPDEWVIGLLGSYRRFKGKCEIAEERHHPPHSFVEDDPKLINQAEMFEEVEHKEQKNLGRVRNRWCHDMIPQLGLWT